MRGHKFCSVLGVSGGGSLLPPELQACEYLQGDGNAYIQTNFNANNITTINCICQQDSTSGGGVVFGCGAATNSTHRRFGLAIYNSNYFIWAWSKGNERTTSNIESSKLLDFSTIKADKIANFNDTNVIYINNPTNLNTYQNLAIFAGNFLEGLAINNSNLKIKILQSNLFNFVAAYIKAEKTYTDNKGIDCIAGTAGFWDLQNRIFYTNDGSGAFTHGADINI